MPQEQFTIHRRPGYELHGAITVTIECDPLASMGVKLGLAVRVAVKSGAYLAGANLAGASLAGANLAGANLAGASLTRAYLAGADLAGAYLTEADLAGASLAGANLAGANLAGANLARASLAGADLARADLTRAYLAGADLTRAYLAGADLAGADLAGAYLTEADLAGAKINSEPVTLCFAQIMRDDGFAFLAFEMEAGGIKIMAGCRWFTLAEFRAHVAREYPNSTKETETLWILDAIEQRAGDMDIALTPEPAAKPKRAKVAK